MSAERDRWFGERTCRRKIPYVTAADAALASYEMEQRGIDCRYLQIYACRWNSLLGRHFHLGHMNRAARQRHDRREEKRRRKVLVRRWLESQDRSSVGTLDPK